MQITTFNPMILSPKADEVIRMKDANGFHVDVARVESLPQDMTTMRMNVRDFEEAYEFLKAHGFKNARGEDHAVESASAKSCLMISPSGFSIQLTQHIRKEDKKTIIDEERRKAFEKAHPEYERLFPMITKEIHDICMEEFGKAFKAIDARMKERAEEDLEKYHVSAEDDKEMREILMLLLKQVDSDIKESVQKQFAEHKR